MLSAHVRVYGRAAMNGSKDNTSRLKRLFIQSTVRSWMILLDLWVALQTLTYMHTHMQLSTHTESG